MPRKNAKVYTEPSQAFQKKVLAERVFVLGWCMTFTKHKQNAEDLCQDVMIHLLGSETSFKNDKSFQGWIYTVTQRTFINKFRKEKRRPFDYTDDFSKVNIPVHDKHFRDDKFKEIINSLPENQKEALKMKAQGYKTNEIASVQQKSTNAVLLSIRSAKSEIHSKYKRTYRLRRDWPYEYNSSIIIIPKDTILRQTEIGGSFKTDGYYAMFDEQLVLLNPKWFMQVKEPRQKKKPVQLTIFKNY